MILRKMSLIFLAQVLYKRKPVQPVPPPERIEKNAEVLDRPKHTYKEPGMSLTKERSQIWIMPKSGEIFTDYDSYLKRYVSAYPSY